jgi:hypothetical protein
MKKDNFINQTCIGGRPIFKRSPRNKKTGTHSKPTKPKIIKYACIIRYLIEIKVGISIVKIHDNISKKMNKNIIELPPINATIISR